jgi:hypothetical protein
MRARCTVHSLYGEILLKTIKSAPKTFNQNYRAQWAAYTVKTLDLTVHACVTILCLPSR